MRISDRSSDVCSSDLRASMRLSRPLAVAAVTVLLAAGYSGLWYHAEGLIEDGVRSWIAEARRHGNDVRFSSLSFDGFPFAVTATTTDVRIVRPDGFVWESGPVSAPADRKRVV